jgi:hypothetical protein
LRAGRAELRKALAVLGGVALLLAVLLPVQLEVSEEADALHAGGLVAAGERLLHGGKDDVVVELVAQVLAQALALGLGQLLDDAGTAGLAALGAEGAHIGAATVSGEKAVSSGHGPARLTGSRGAAAGRPAWPLATALHA